MLGSFKVKVLPRGHQLKSLLKNAQSLSCREGDVAIFPYLNMISKRNVCKTMGPNGDADNRQTNMKLLPLPSLDNTIKRYLEALQPLVNPDQFSEAKRLAESFLVREGPKIQNELKIKQSKEINWAYIWWLNDMYLSARSPLPVNSSFGHTWPPQNFKNQEDQLMFAARMTNYMIDVRDQVLCNKYPEDTVGPKDKAQPLCMDQYYKQFGTYRVPGEKLDSLKDTSSANVDHIVVAHKNVFYAVDFKSGNRRLTNKEIFTQLSQIVEGASMDSPDPYPMGILTTQNRTIWAAVRQKLMLNPTNKKNLEDIENAPFLLSLEDGLSTEFNSKIPFVKSKYNVNGRDDTNLSVNTIHGGGSLQNSGNRWFDKSFQIQVCKDGGVGATVEHSGLDGAGFLGIADDMQKCILSGDFEKVGPSGQDSGKFTPRRLNWTLDDSLKADIKNACTAMNNLVRDTELTMFRYPGYGKDFIKSCKVGPDVFIQLALQMAYYTLYGKFTATYESAGLRRFKYGRVDNIRTNSMEVKDWVESMDNVTIPNTEKVKLHQAAAKKHTTIMNENINGNGIDNHLLGIREQAAIMGIPIPFLQHETNKIFNYFKLSTSQLVTIYDQYTGYGAVVPDGYGCGYNPKKNFIIFLTGSFRACGDTNEKFLKALNDSLDKIKVIYSNLN